MELNGSNFISKTEVTEETFKGKLSHVVITCNEETEKSRLIGEHNQMELVQIAYYTQETDGLSDGWYFILRDIPRTEMEMLQARSDIDYLSMMTGVEL